VWTLLLRRSDRQQFLVKAAELPRSVHEVDFQNPVSIVAMPIEGAHRPMVFRVHIQCHLVVRNSFVRKLADEMARNGSAELPTRPSPRAIGRIGRARCR
jgi:hypothetical protein